MDIEVIKGMIVEERSFRKEVVLTLRFADEVIVGCFYIWRHLLIVFLFIPT